MKSLLKKINVLAITAMLIGGGFAFATKKEANENSQLFRKDANGEWSIPVMPGTYDCTFPLSEQCVTELDENDLPINTIPGRYSPKSAR